MKVIVAGSRSITDEVYIKAAMYDFEYYQGKITELVCGMASGVDLIARKIAKEEWRIPVKEFPANWASFGKSAGPKRNREMGEYADGLVAVWDGKSSGTIDMVGYMMAIGKPIIMVTVRNRDER